MGELDVVQLTKEYASQNADAILMLEKFWTAIGDEQWTAGNLMYELPMKWELSHVALFEGKIAGYQIGSLRDGNAFLNKIVVDNEYRNLRVGKLLLRAFLHACSQQGIGRLHFRVRTDNPAVSFYDKLGFHKRKELDYTRKDGVASYFYDTPLAEVVEKV